MLTSCWALLYVSRAWLTNQIVHRTVRVVTTYLTVSVLCIVITVSVLCISCITFTTYVTVSVVCISITLIRLLRLTIIITTTMSRSSRSIIIVFIFTTWRRRHYLLLFADVTTWRWRHYLTADIAKSVSGIWPSFSAILSPYFLFLIPLVVSMSLCMLFRGIGLVLRIILISRRNRSGWIRRTGWTSEGVSWTRTRKRKIWIAVIGILTVDWTLCLL